MSEGSGMHDYDLVISGGGLVGGSLACALRDTGLRVAVIEAVTPRADTHPSYDERVIALAWSSRRILTSLGLWPLVAGGAEPIRAVHVSQRGGCGLTRIDHGDEGVEALGYVAPARLLGHALQTALADAPNLRFRAPARLVDFTVHPDGVELEVTAEEGVEHLRTRLLVAADGGDSLVRQRLDVAVRERDYGQDAVIATVTPDRPQPGVAYERFTDSGPLALLPMTEGRYSVVWTALAEQTEELLGLSDRDFLERLQARFGFRLGRFSRPSARHAYPLRLMLVSDPVAPRLALIGNAAHALHPVAGQGFNLGLRDVAALAEVLAAARASGEDIGAQSVLDAYRDWRSRDQAAVANLTDTLAWLFINPCPPLRAARGLGLLGVGLVPPLRHTLARRFMGLTGRQTRLARGLPLETDHG